MWWQPCPPARPPAPRQSCLRQAQGCALSLLGLLCRYLSVPPASGSSRQLQPVREAAAWHVVRALPHLGRLLQQLLAGGSDAAMVRLEDGSNEEMLGGICWACGTAVEQLEAIGAMGSEQQVAAWAAAGEARPR